MEEAPDDTLNLLKLANKRLDYIMIDASMFKFITTIDPRFAEHRNDMQINPHLTYLLDYSVAFKTDAESLKIKKELEAIFNNDEFAALIQEYLVKLSKGAAIQ